MLRGHMLERHGSAAESSSQDSFTVSDGGDQSTQPNSHMSAPMMDDVLFNSVNEGSGGNMSFFLVNSSPIAAKSIADSPNSLHDTLSKDHSPHLVLQKTNSSNNNNNNNGSKGKRFSILTSFPDNVGAHNKSSTTLNNEKPFLHLVSSEQCISPSSQELSIIMSKNSGVLPPWLTSSDLGYLHPHLAHSKKDVDLADVAEDVERVAAYMRRYTLTTAEDTLASDKTDDIALQLQDISEVDQAASYMSVLAEINSAGSKGSVSFNGPSPALMQQYMGWWTREVGGSAGASQTEASRPKALTRFAPLTALLSGYSTENEDVLSSPQCSPRLSHSRDQRNVLSDHSTYSCSLDEGTSVERQSRLSRNTGYSKRAACSRLLHSRPADLDVLPIIKQESIASFRTQDLAAPSSRMDLHTPVAAPLVAENSGTSATRRFNLSHISSNDSASRLPCSREESAVVDHLLSPLSGLQPLVAISSEEVVSLSANKRRHSSHRKASEGNNAMVTLLPPEAPCTPALPPSLNRSMQSHEVSFVHTSPAEASHNSSLLPPKAQPNFELTPVTALTSSHYSSSKGDSHRLRFVTDPHTRTPPKPKLPAGFFKRSAVGVLNEGTTVITGVGPKPALAEPQPTPPQPSTALASSHCESTRGSSISALEKSSMTPQPPSSILQKDVRPRRNTVAAIGTKKSDGLSSLASSTRTKR